MKEEIIRKGNENLLNESSEGIMIIDQENEVLLFANTAAKTLNLRAKQEYSFGLFENGEHAVDLDKKLFSHLNINSQTNQGRSAYSIVDHIKKS